MNEASGGIDCSKALAPSLSDLSLRTLIAINQFSK